jgi:hypothetical protein
MPGLDMTAQASTSTEGCLCQNTTICPAAFWAASAPETHPGRAQMWSLLLALATRLNYE